MLIKRQTVVKRLGVTDAQRVAVSGSKLRVSGQLLLKIGQTVASRKQSNLYKTNTKIHHWVSVSVQRG